MEEKGIFMTKLERSQAAHNRLWIKHKASNSDKSRKLLNYHAECFNAQRVKGSVLKKRERRIIFKNCMRWG